MSLEQIKLEMIFDSIIGLANTIQPGNVAHHANTIRYHAELGKEKLAELDVKQDKKQISINKKED
jgi:hypothetical protein